MTTKIKVICIDQVLSLEDNPVIASGGVNEDLIEFEFCQKWDGFSKTAVFYRKPEDVYYNLVDSDNTCVIPQEVLKEDGYLYFGVFGSNANGVIRTSEILKYKVEKGAITENIKPSDPTPSIYEQLLAKYQEILELCEGTATAESEFEVLITNKQTEFETSINSQFDAYKEETNAKFNYKVNITDIVDNLTSTDTNKPLSAKQGKVLKEAIDSKTFPVDTSMSDTSTNAVQNKVIKAYVDSTITTVINANY